MAYGRVVLLLLPFALLFASSLCGSPTIAPERKGIEISIGVGIGIGVGNDSEAPPPSSSPHPSEFLNVKQYQAYLVIQQFKSIITSDPGGVTQSWVGPRPCDYQGFYCGAPEDSPDEPTIAAVDFNGYSLSAPTVVGFLDQLPDLAFFHSNSNNFSGPIPDLSGLRYLRELDVSNSAHTGDFPAAVLSLSNLIFLDIRFNLFAGAVPASVFILDLDVLFLNNNNLNEPLPAEIGSSPVAYLTLANNGFTGPIPQSISKASKTLIEVLLLNNNLSGCLPQEIGLLSVATVFDAGSNCITGPIPWSFGCLLKVEQLNLAENLLYGEVPDLVCRLATDGNLANLSLSGNYFTGLGHSCWGLIEAGVLDVRQNCILGLPEQRPPTDCARFMLRRKYCPFRYEVPCCLSTCAVKPVAPPRYVTYEALHQSPRN
ncbi:uncharacterized protein At4g06744-like [Zingiber officinale]|uniref:Leucine-rich repeat-containing N-terminal plant-type domain-containing protein n=1 Tax=Zingiber officinale TaxID=94328 RepID=A0A8J5L3F5_ZINOF|nr:uncharacterized protein At4g06744-like [Zingiber officinale]KAG6510250.1 hypothetical protein ZIOFF_028259 [Zingiber officinale]